MHLLDSAPDKGYFTDAYDSDGKLVPDNVMLHYVYGKYSMHSDMVDKLTQLGFKKFQLVYVPLTDKDREIVAQGVLTNTIANVGRRGSNSPFAYPDYFTRGNNEFADILSNRGESGSDFQSIEWAHLRPLSYRSSDTKGY